MFRIAAQKLRDELGTQESRADELALSLRTERTAHHQAIEPIRSELAAVKAKYVELQEKTKNMTTKSKKRGQEKVALKRAWPELYEDVGE